MIAKEGRIILIPLFLLAFPIGIYAHAVNSITFTIIYGILGILFLFSLNFFRDPKRNIPMAKREDSQYRASQGYGAPTATVAAFISERIVARHFTKSEA